MEKKVVSQAAYPVHEKELSIPEVFPHGEQQEVCVKEMTDACHALIFVYLVRCEVPSLGEVGIIDKRGVF
jgi:hypothetical protein